MAYYSLHAYDADVWIPEFAGLRQDDEIAQDLRFAIHAENVETFRGVLQPMAAPEVLDYSFSGVKIETLAKFHRRWYTGTGSKDWMVIAAGGKLYYKQSLNTGAFTQLPYPTGVTAWQSNVWSFVTYEINPAGSSSPVDVLLMSNEKDGMIIITPPYTATVNHPNWTVDKVDTQGKKFGVIERYAERIWGGAIPEDPDMLMYSRPYDPTNWTAATSEEEPEDGAGDISQPSWDGDSFTGLRAFGNQLLAFKKTRVWRILGTDPGEYTFKEQYGGGAPFIGTVAVDTERIFMAEKDGMSVYDGLSVSPFQRPMIERIWKRVNRAAMEQMCAVLYKNRYYLSVPLDSDTANNALIVYSVEEGTFLLYTDIHIESLLATEDALYATSSTVPGKIIVLKEDSWETGVSSGKLTRWETAWIDFGRKSMAKGGYEIYFSPEVKGGPVTFRFTIETEKKRKSKQVTVQTTTFKAKQKRVRFGGSSRRFRFIIETLNQPSHVVWRLIGGIQMVVETDPD